MNGHQHNNDKPNSKAAAQHVSAISPGYKPVDPFHANQQDNGESLIDPDAALSATQLPRAFGENTAQLKKGDRKGRKARRLAKHLGIHPDEVEPDVGAIREEQELLYPEPDERIADAALELKDDFIWTSPGGMLEYKTLFTYWDQYKPVLRARVARNKQGTFDGLSDSIDALDADAEEEKFAPLLGQARALIAGAQDTDGFVTLNDDFARWLNDGTVPVYLNCWEAVLYACVKAGKLKRADMLAYYNELQSKSSENVFRKFVLGRSIEQILEEDEVIPDHMAVAGAERGNILCFWKDESIDHVAIYMGEGECMSIWIEDTMSFTTTTYAKLIGKYDPPHLEIIKL